MIKMKLTLSNFIKLFIIIIFSTLVYDDAASQKSDIPLTKSLQNNNISKDEEKVIPDHKILSSTESFIEIEFYPQFTKEFDFLNSVGSTDKMGSPDIKMRSFPIYLPVNTNNRVEILDEKYEDISGVEIKPVPTLKISKDKDGVFPEYIKDQNEYNKNKLIPGNSATVTNSGAVRNKYFGYINFYPAQYNPSTGTLRKFSFIKVRIVFGGSPVYQNRPISIQEKYFFDGAAINSKVAINWSTDEFNSQKSVTVKNSVLASGDFYKIEIKESGMYKLDKNYLQGNSINAGSIDPRTIKIYGNGGSELPYNNAVNSPTDLVENKILVVGEEDGRFDDNDHIIFYGRNPNEWGYDSLNKTYFHNVNNFSKSNYYFLTYAGINGQRMALVNSPNQTGIIPLSSFKERYFEEPEVNNLGSTGYLWLSQRISLNESFTFNRELKGYVDGSFVNMRFRFGNGSFFNNIWRLEDLNSGFLTSPFIPGITGFSHINLSYLGDNPYGVNYILNPGKSSINFKASLP
ncbi:MAG: C25 family peptidase propeptide domain-containing protein, partial [Ignavibacteria bacterium]